MREELSSCDTEHMAGKAWKLHSVAICRRRLPATDSGKLPSRLALLPALDGPFQRSKMQASPLKTTCPWDKVVFEFSAILKTGQAWESKAYSDIHGQYLPGVLTFNNDP